MYAKIVGLCINLNINVYKKFKSICAIEGESMSYRIRILIKEYIEQYTKEHNTKI